MTLPIQVGPANDHDESQRPLPRVPAGRPDRAPGRGRLLRARHPVRVGLGAAPQRQAPGAAQHLAGAVLLGALRVRQPGAARSRRRRSRAHSLGMRVDRTVSGGVHEDYDLVNYGRAPGAPDDRDRDPVRLRRHLRRQGRRARPPRRDQHAAGSARGASCARRYVNRDFERELVVEAARSDSRPQFANGRLVFIAEIAPKHVWHACLRWLPMTQFEAPAGDPAVLRGRRPAPDQSQPASPPSPPRDAGNHVVRRAWDQAQLRHRRAAARGPGVRARASSSRPPACPGS